MINYTANWPKECTRRRSFPQNIRDEEMRVFLKVNLGKFINKRSRLCLLVHSPFGDFLFNVPRHGAMIHFATFHLNRYNPHLHLLPLFLRGQFRFQSSFYYDWAKHFFRCLTCSTEDENWLIRTYIFPVGRQLLFCVRRTFLVKLSSCYLLLHSFTFTGLVWRRSFARERVSLGWETDVATRPAIHVEHGASQDPRPVEAWRRSETVQCPESRVLSVQHYYYYYY